MQLEELLRQALQKGATDVHLKAGVIPVIRRHGSLRPLAADATPLTGEEIEFMAMGLLNEKQRAHFDEFREVDIGYGITGLGRFRVSIFRQRGTIRLVIRNIPFKVPTMEELTLPPVIEKVARLERCLVLITGVAGS